MTEHNLHYDEIQRYMQKNVAPDDVYKVLSEITCNIFLLLNCIEANSVNIKDSQKELADRTARNFIYLFDCICEDKKISYTEKE